MRIHIFGIGSSHGADRVGWIVAERLMKHDRCNAEVQVLSTPVRLLDHLTGCDIAILVDACQMGAPAGTIIRMTWPDPRIANHQSLSSHGIGLGETLKLAEQLGRLPESVVLYCLEVGAEPVRAIDGASIAGIEELERRLREELNSINS